MSLLQALLIALVVGGAYLARRIAGDPQLERPIVLGPIVGLITGDVTTGIIVGGALELVFIGAAPIGGTAPPNVAIGSAVGVALAISSGSGTAAALVLAVPAAVLGTFCELFAKTVCSFLVHRADTAAEDARSTSIMTVVWTGNAIHFFAYAIPTFLALYFGNNAVQGLVDSLSDDVMNGLNTAAAILPAVGFGILLSVLFNKSLFPLFFAGFTIAAFTNFTVIGVALLATALVIVIYRRGRSASHKELTDTPSPTPATAPTPERQLPKTTLK
ncbi:PTS mannose/fructose/sorbose/N-acetylgalactosamine transporter subunit IIC [Paramicrobacterium agarici]|uniref:PTS system mannose-specific IID component/fructoselysine and glucoselysine-specific PTS system IIC component n=1 Tax=Paramicrobacterium agarici TaxID=630514 RepID=A0A2A9DV86_9MICO|nr:PTS sugar transporter subunit IIC [Microbacterium agarici]PFG30697.1 PTS system mannose-specific IID component/fructoselysine and glucoselysine-specific PTS system IIC component [Microbacterium agarici]